MTLFSSLGVVAENQVDFDVDNLTVELNQPSGSLIDKDNLIAFISSDCFDDCQCPDDCPECHECHFGHCGLFSSPTFTHYNIINKNSTHPDDVLYPSRDLNQVFRPPIQAYS